VRPLLGIPPWFHTSDVDSMLVQEPPYGFRDAVNASLLHEWQNAIVVNTSHAVLSARRSCAVVGSSGALLNASFGRQIDAADHVIRMNTAPTIGFEAHVGSKTTIRLATLNAGLHARKEGLLRKRTTQLVYYCHVFWIGACYHWIPREPVPRVSPSLLRVAQVLLNTTRLFPSTGLMSILLGMSLCERVNLYGFGLTSDTRCGKYYGKCVRPSLYYSHLSRSQIRAEGRKAGHFVEVGGAYHDLESETAFLDSIGYAAPMKENVRAAKFEGMDLRIEPWIHPKPKTRSRQKSEKRR